MAGLAAAASAVGAPRAQATADDGGAVWLRRAPGSAPAALRLLCIPHAGGGASTFNGWRRVLPPWIELVKLQLPGREDRRADVPLTRVGDALAAILPHVRPLLERPLAVYGHSMGALIAFELTRALRGEGHASPLALLVSGRRAPHKPLRGPLLHSLPERELVAYLRDMGGTLPGLLESPRWRRHYLPTLRADLELSDVYTCAAEPLVDCPLHAWVGESDRLMPREDWEAWSEQARAEFERQVLPGGHFFSRAGRAALMASICDALTRRLEQRSEGVGPPVATFAGAGSGEISPA